MTIVEEARAYATAAHAGQRYGNGPYTDNLAAVAELARPFGETAEAVAWLHDVLEDQPGYRNGIAGLQAEFGVSIAFMVEQLTPPWRPTRRQRVAAMLSQLAALGQDDSRGLTALVVKVCDRLANVRAGGKNNMYLKEHAAFLAASYRPGLCDALWNELAVRLADNRKDWRCRLSEENLKAIRRFSKKHFRKLKAAGRPVSGERKRCLRNLRQLAEKLRREEAGTWG